jgi:hypothetical protein
MSIDDAADKKSLQADEQTRLPLSLRQIKRNQSLLRQDDRYSECSRVMIFVTLLTTASAAPAFKS